MTNTAVSYLYRSASNFKISMRVVVAGNDASAIADIWGALEDDELFIPGQVGLPALQSEQGWELTRDEDGVWHELVNIEATAAPAAEGSQRVSTLAEAFRAAHNNWDVATAEEELFGD